MVIIHTYIQSVYIRRITRFYVSNVEIGHYVDDGFFLDGSYRKSPNGPERFRIARGRCLVSYNGIYREKYFCPTLFQKVQQLFSAKLAGTPLYVPNCHHVHAIAVPNTYINQIPQKLGRKCRIPLYIFT